MYATTPKVNPVIRSLAIKSLLVIGNDLNGFAVQGPFGPRSRIHRLLGHQVIEELKAQR